MRLFAYTFTFCLLFTCVAANSQQEADAVAPEPGNGTSYLGNTPPVQAKDWMIAAANPLAVQAGANILEQGGSAADAMIAVQATLGLVEPQSSGLGGGAFLLWYDATTKVLTTLDGRETAPLAAHPTLLQQQGVPMNFYDAVVGGRSVGVPGLPALLEEAHKRWGKLEWSGLFAGPIKLATDGFKVSPRLAALVAGDVIRLSYHPKTRAYFIPDGTPLQAGDILKNPTYADTLTQLAQHGAKTFYTGETSKQIIDAVQNTPDNPGLLDETDLAIYKVQERLPVCAPYRGYKICGMGPPSSGGLAVGQILGLLSSFDMAALGPDSPESWRLIGDATRLAFADRGRYVADSDFVPVPVKGLLSEDYLKNRAQLLRGDDALPEIIAGTPEFDHALIKADGMSNELPSTTHISIKDIYGNVLSMTSSIENAFGSRVMVAGFLLNNQLTDFSFNTHQDGNPIANRVEPGKRPRSSMAPTIVLKDDQPVLTIGSPGGSRIIPYVAKTLIAHLDWKMNIQAAINLPHLVNRFGVYDIEQGTRAEEFSKPLQDLGYEVSIRDLNSGLHGIVIGPDGLQGGADPRREGMVLGRRP